MNRKLINGNTFKMNSELFFRILKEFMPAEENWFRWNINFIDVSLGYMQSYIIFFNFYKSLSCFKLEAQDGLLYSSERRYRSSASREIRVALSTHLPVIFIQCDKPAERVYYIIIIFIIVINMTLTLLSSSVFFFFLQLSPY